MLYIRSLLTPKSLIRTLAITVIAIPLVMVGCTCTHNPAKDAAPAEDQMNPTPPADKSTGEPEIPADEDDDIPPPEAPMDQDNGSEQAPQQDTGQGK